MRAVSKTSVRHILKLRPCPMSHQPAGLRPKLSGPGEPPADFALHGPAQHGVHGYLALYGIESPGLTSCLVLAEEVAARLLQGDGG